MESKKIKAFIAHNNKKVINNIENDIQRLENVEIVGSAKTGKETCKKIIKLKPEIVFVKYDMGDMDALELMEKTADSLGKEETPEFKIISKDILERHSKNDINQKDKYKINQKDKYKINKKENKKKKIKETANVKGMGTKEIIETLEKLAK